MLYVILMLVGLGLGAAYGRGEFGVMVGVALGWLFARSLKQDQVIAGLRKQVEDLLARPQVPAGQASAERVLPPAAVPRPAPALTPPAPTPPAPEPAPAPGHGQADAEHEFWLPSEQSASAPPAMPASRPARVPAAPVSAARMPAPSPADTDLLAPLRQWLLGGNTIVKAGVAILFIGLAFLAKFASEHVRVPIEWRLGGIAAVAIVLLFVGWRLRHRRSGYAQVLQGGAVAVLYLTLFVAFRFYGVLAVGPVFAFMALVAALAAALAVLQDAPALAVIGALGGFATPILVSTGGGSHVALFSYYLVLDLGIALVAWYRHWRALNLLGFGFTYAVGTAWGLDLYQDIHYASAQGFLIAFFLLFVAILLLPARHAARAAAGSAWRDNWVNGSLLFGLPTISFALQYGMVHRTEYGVAISALVLAAFYVLLALWMRSRAGMKLAFEGSLALGTVFLTLVIPFALDARATAGAWALEGAGLVWLGFRQGRGAARAFGYALQVLAGLSMVAAHARHGAPEVFLNAYFFNGVLAAAAALAAALFVHRAAALVNSARQERPGDAAGGEWLAEPLLIAWATLWLLAAAALQIDRFVAARLAPAAWLASLSGIAVLYGVLSLRLHWPRLALPALAHAPLAALVALFYALLLSAPGDDGGWWAWPSALLAHGLVLARLAPVWPDAARRMVHALGVLIVAVLGALQGRAITGEWGDYASAWPWLGWLALPALLLLALPRPGSARFWPLRAEPQAYQLLAAGVLTASLLAWTLLANVISRGSAQPLPHLPLLNPLDLGIALALFACWQWLRSAAAAPWLATRAALAPTLLAGAVFIWLNAMLIRAFHHWGGVPFRAQAWMESLPVHTGLTLLWTATALGVMWWAARRALRAPWMVGAALLAAVVAKLALVDLSGSGTVTRIVSFIGVGVLMLVIGYVAPPPAGEKHDAQS